MPPQEQADLWMALRDRMKVDWNEMTMQEKKAGMLHTLYDSTASDLHTGRHPESWPRVWLHTGLATKTAFHSDGEAIPRHEITS